MPLKPTLSSTLYIVCYTIYGVMVYGIMENYTIGYYVVVHNVLLHYFNVKMYYTAVLTWCSNQ